ncbi:UNVERIFIED_CONTAM: hypothetical protein PYX00_009391 [Menopon gallinae]|uniref:Uncharacterized protein n=1 Tax=Menopon gallinae TaxID=328185 RepID=A0AAW2HBS1_9NEOP
MLKTKNLKNGANFRDSVDGPTTAASQIKLCLPVDFCLLVNMRWHEMAIDQAGFEDKLETFMRDASKAEEMFENYLTQGRKTSSIWNLQWFHAKFRRKRTLPDPVSEMMKIMEMDEKMYQEIADTREKLDQNTEAESETDAEAEMNLRRTLTQCEEVLSQVGERFAKYNNILKSMSDSQDDEASASVPPSRKMRRFHHILRLRN